MNMKYLVLGFPVGSGFSFVKMRVAAGSGKKNIVPDTVHSELNYVLPVHFKSWK